MSLWLSIDLEYRHRTYTKSIPFAIGAVLMRGDGEILGTFEASSKTEPDDPEDDTTAFWAAPEQKEVKEALEAKAQDPLAVALQFFGWVRMLVARYGSLTPISDNVQFDLGGLDSFLSKHTHPSGIRYLAEKDFKYQSVNDTSDYMLAIEQTIPEANSFFAMLTKTAEKKFSDESSWPIDVQHPFVKHKHDPLYDAAVGAYVYLGARKYAKSVYDRIKAEIDRQARAEAAKEWHAATQC
jgi:hypothetical protein